MKHHKKPPTCPYCNRAAHLRSGDRLYAHRPDLADKWFWCCQWCDAYVGCHPGTKRPLGRLAGPELRKLKMAAHSAFDPLWRNGAMTRNEAYAALAKFMGLTKKQCHIGKFDEGQCRRVIEFSTLTPV